MFSLTWPWCGWNIPPPSLYPISTQTLQMSCGGVATELNFPQSADGLKRGIRIVSHTVLLLLDRSENSCKALTDKIESSTGSVILLKNLEDTYVPSYIGKSIFKSFRPVVHHLVWPWMAVTETSPTATVKKGRLSQGSRLTEEKKTNANERTFFLSKMADAFCLLGYVHTYPASK